VRGANVPAKPHLTHIDTRHGLINWVNMHIVYMTIVCMHSVNVFTYKIIIKLTMLPWTAAGENICHGKKKNCCNNAWVYNVHVYVLCVWLYKLAYRKSTSACNGSNYIWQLFIFHTSYLEAIHL